MSVSTSFPESDYVGPCLVGAEGELMDVRITADARQLEALLEALADAPFPINPEIHHGRPVTVRFPAYRGQAERILQLLSSPGLENCRVHIRPMWSVLSEEV